MTETWNNLATTLAEAGRREEALRALDMGLAELPGQPDLLAARRIIAAMR
jgi:hypothetical protein